MSRVPGAWLATVPLLAILGLVMVAPIVLACTDSLGSIAAPSLDAYRLLFGSAFLTVFWRTIAYASLVTAGCVLLGVPIAYTLLRTRGIAFTVLMAAVVLPFAMGTLVRSYVWLALLGRTGLFNTALQAMGIIDHPLELAYTYPGLIAASIQVELPLFVLPIYGVMRRTGIGLSTAAKALGADPVTAWFTVFLPAIRSGLLTSTTLVFLTSLGFYITPVLLGPPNAYLLSQELEVRLNTLGDQAGASARIVVMLATIALVVGLLAASRGLSGMRPGMAGLRPSGGLWRLAEYLARRLSPLRWAAALGPVGLVTALSLVSVVAIVPLGLSGDTFMTFPPKTVNGAWVAEYLSDYDMLDSTIFSITLAIGAGMLATAIGGAAAIASLSLGPRAVRLVSLASATPLVVPSILVASAVFLASLQLPHLDPTLLFLAIYTTLGLPFAFLVVRAAAERIDPRLGDAGAVLGARPMIAVATIYAPLLVPSLLASLFFAFLFAFEDVSAGLFLSTSDRMPLAMRLWQSMADALTPLPAAVSLLFLSALAIGAGLRFAVAHYRRRARSG